MTSIDARRSALLGLFRQRPPLDDAERRAIAHLAALLAAGPDPFARTTLPAHVTASSVVFDLRTGTILLHLHRRLDRWLQPGGHVEPGERPEDAAVRETLEETGVAATHPASGPVVLHLDEHPGPDAHIHLDLRYLLLADRSMLRSTIGETTGRGAGPTLRWVAPREARTVSDDSLARALDALDAGAHRMP